MSVREFSLKNSYLLYGGAAKFVSLWFYFPSTGCHSEVL